MKNVFFLNNAQNENAARISAVSLLQSPVQVTDDAQVNFALVEGNLKKDAYEAVANVIDMGTIYNVIHKDTRLAQAVCDVLFEEFLKEAANSGIDVSKLLADSAPQKQLTLEEMVEMYNIEEVVINGVNITEGKVVAMMGAAGLAIGGRCETKLGGASILGFEAGTNGVLVVVAIDGENAPRKLMADHVKAIGQKTAPVGPARSEEDALLSSEIAKLMSAPTGGVEAASRSAVSDAIFAGGMTIRTVEDELTEAERFELAENERIAGREKWINDRKENAAKVSGSDAAQRILALANQQLKGGEAPQENKSQGNGQSTRRPGPAAKQNQTNGGNVQMSTQTKGAQQDRPVQGVAAGKAGSSVRGPKAGAPASTPATPARTATPSNGKSQRRPQAGAQASAGNTGTRTRLNVGATGVSSNTRGATTRLGAGAPVAGNANRPAGTVSLRMDTPMSRNGFGGKWFEDAGRFPLAMSGADFEASRQNLELGITDVKFYDAHEYAASRGYEARDNDMAIIVLSFGPELSFNFTIKLSSSPDAKQPWYCSNISFVKTKNGNGGYWAYTNGRRKDDAALIEKKGEWVMADPREIEKAAPDALWTVKGQGWVNDTIYGMRMGEEIIAQVMRFADYAYSALFVTEVEAE